MATATRNGKARPRTKAKANPKLTKGGKTKVKLFKPGVPEVGPASAYLTPAMKEQAPPEEVPEGAEIEGIPVPRADWTLEQLSNCCLTVGRKSGQMAWLRGRAVNLAEKFWPGGAFGGEKVDGLTWKEWQQKVNYDIPYSTLQRHRELARLVTYEQLAGGRNMMAALAMAKAKKEEPPPPKGNDDTEAKDKGNDDTEAKDKDNDTPPERAEEGELRTEGERADVNPREVEVEVINLPPIMSEEQAVQALDEIAKRLPGGLPFMKRLLENLIKQEEDKKRAKKRVKK